MGEWGLARGICVYGHSIFNLSSCRLWVWLVFFLIFSVLGFVRFPVFGGLWAGWHAAEDADGSIRAAFRNQLPGQIGFILAMTWFAIWRPPKIIAETRNRIRITPN